MSAALETVKLRLRLGPHRWHKPWLQLIGETADQPAYGEQKAQHKDEAKDCHLCVIPKPRGIPPIQQLQDGREQNTQNQEYRPELEDPSHSINIKNAYEAVLKAI